MIFCSVCDSAIAAFRDMPPARNAVTSRPRRASIIDICKNAQKRYTINEATRGLKGLSPAELAHLEAIHKEATAHPK